jgi:hypothetical protein
MSIIYPYQPFGDLPITTIVPDPDDKELFIPWFTRLYEDLATTINLKDWTEYTIAIAATKSSIPNIPNQGAFIICVAGTMDGMPACTYSMIKTDSTAAGVPALIQTQPGTTGSWSGIKLLISTTSSSTNFQINHDGASTLIGNFNVRFIGTM